MGNELDEKRTKLILLEEKIKSLKGSREELLKARQEYYELFYNTEREDYAFLTNVPENTKGEKHPLYDYSTLNVDVIGKLICKLAQKYEGLDFASKRVDCTEQVKDKNEIYYEEYPVLVVGEKTKIHEGSENEDNIILEFDPNINVKDYPTDKPVFYVKGIHGESKIRSNYNKLINYMNGLSFDSKGHQYIEDLIFSLAYYQKSHGIDSMTSEETKDVYKKIFKRI